MSFSDLRNHLLSIWYHSEPSDITYSQNQFLGWDFFFDASYSKTALIKIFKYVLELDIDFIKAFASMWIQNLTRNAKSRNRVSKKLSAFISSLWVLLPTSCTLNQNGGVFLKGRFMIIFLYFCQGNYSNCKNKSETYLTKAF